MCMFALQHYHYWHVIIIYIYIYVYIYIDCTKSHPVAACVRVVCYISRPVSLQKQLVALYLQIYLNLKTCIYTLPVDVVIIYTP